MKKYYKKVFYLFSTLAIAFTHIMKAEATCPSDIIKPFVGQWQGKAFFVSADGSTQQPLGTKDEFAIVDCKSFKVTINYLDSAGKTVRTLNLKATSDKSKQVGLFAVSGNITEASVVNTMNGSISSIQDGTLLGSFSGSAGGQPAYLNELMNVFKLPTGEIHLVRTVQMFSGKRGGPYIGSRVVNEVRIQPSL